MWTLLQNIWKRALPLVLLVAANGCLDMHQEIFIEDDGSGRVIVKYAALDAFVQGSPMVKFLDPTKTELAMDKASILKHFDKKEGLKLRSVDMWSEGENRMVRMTIDFENISRLDEANLSYSWKIEDGYKVFRIILDKHRHAKTQMNTIERAVANSFNDVGFHFKVHLPGKVVDSNASNVKWNVAEFFVPLNHFLDPDESTKTFFAKTEASWMDRISAWFDDLFGD